MIHFEGNIHQEELKCSQGTTDCDGINVEVVREPIDWDVNNTITYVAICNGCYGYLSDEV